MVAILTYEGYTLTERAQGGYRSVIDGETVSFDTASQWKQYIDLIIKGNGRKKIQTVHRG